MFEVGPRPTSKDIPTRHDGGRVGGFGGGQIFG